MTRTNFSQEAGDRLAITDKIYRYCRSMDRLDVALGHSVFHEDGYADCGEIYRGTGRGWIDYVLDLHRNLLQHSHQVTNVIIDIDGDRAGSESYAFVTLRGQDGDRIILNEMWMRYIDNWSKRDGEWAIDRRDCIVDYGSMREVEPVPGDPRSRRDESDPCYQFQISRKGGED